MQAHVARLRARFLTAMSLPVAAALGVGCPPARISNDGKDGVVLSDEDVVRNPMTAGAWSVDYRDPPRQEMPSCPGGRFCVAGAREGARGSAPLPFQDCAASVPYPEEPRSGAPPAPGGPAWVGGPDVNDRTQSYHISFEGSWTAHERKAKDPAACCYSWFEPCPGGRPLRGALGETLLAPLVATTDWCGRARASRGEPTPMRRSADFWARAAQFEHASVASFARFALELAALGAPAALVRRAHQAAWDEIAHAELAFALAAELGGVACGPGRLPVEAPCAGTTAAALARATLRDGCVAETRAALEARRDHAAAANPREQAAFARIAADEERHAELAFATLAWLVATFGEPVCAALAAEFELLAASVVEPGVHPELAVVLPCARALLAARPAHAPAQPASAPTAAEAAV